MLPLYAPQNGFAMLSLCALLLVASSRRRNCSSAAASQIEALPHQITAVYGEMLPRQPLRFLLADDPGAGKTIKARLLIKELLIRGDLERCLIVALGSPVEQWQDELREKFGLRFDTVTRDQIENSATGNPFAERDRLILRLDMAGRSDELKAKLQAAPDWNLVICDEAHRKAASYFGGEVKETQRYKLGRLLGTRTREISPDAALRPARADDGRLARFCHRARFSGTPDFPRSRPHWAHIRLPLRHLAGKVVDP